MFFTPMLACGGDSSGGQTERTSTERNIRFQCSPYPPCYSLQQVHLSHQWTGGYCGYWDRFTIYGGIVMYTNSIDYCYTLHIYFAVFRGSFFLLPSISSDCLGKFIVCLLGGYCSFIICNFVLCSHANFYQCCVVSLQAEEEVQEFMSGDHPFEAYVAKLTEFAALRVDILTSSQQVIESS